MNGNTVVRILIAILLCGALGFSYTNYQQIQELRQENRYLAVLIDSVLQVSGNPSAGRADGNVGADGTVGKQGSTGSELLDFFIKMDEKFARDEARDEAKRKVAVSTKYRLEDRYVIVEVRKPEIVGDQAGEVVLDILVDIYGDVKSAKLKSADGITNDDVIEACKKAALRTAFNTNMDLGYKSRQSGTITYIFTAK